MTAAPRKRHHLALGAFFHPTGNHVAAWLHPESQIDAGVNFEHYVKLAQTAERGKFDLVFVADAVATRDGNSDALKRWPQYMAYFDPTVLMAGIAALTKNIGLVATASASFNEPYNIARRFASLDLISHGRIGWNVVVGSSVAEARNFNRVSLDEHEARYGKADEFVEICQGLWDSWEEDAFIRDRQSATYFDPAKLHTLNHAGKYFSVRGPLNVARSPQGHPVLANAGTSDRGKDFAAKFAELIFTPASTLEQAQALYKDIKGRLAKYGREPDDLKITPGLNVIVGHTDSEAEEKHQYLQSLIHPDVGRQILSTEVGVDLSPYTVDGPLPYDIIEANSTISPYRGLILDRARRGNMTIRDVYMWFAGARGNRTLKGSAATVADNIEEWFTKDAVDGFLIQPAVLPGGLDDFVDLVVPELQRRGLLRTEYEGTTLRENLGLPKPGNRFAARTAKVT